VERLRVTLSAIFIVALPPYAQGHSPRWCAAPGAAMSSPPPAVRAASCENIIATQNRINRYFHREVVPKLKACWEGLEGKGTVDADFKYRRVGARWVLASSGVRSSTLADAQEQLALRCLQEAVRDTSFAVERSDAEAKEFQVNWSFPVPWPKDIAEAAQRMIGHSGGGGGGGCGGSENPGPACWDCTYIDIFGTGASFCELVCSGYANCQPAPSGCNLGHISPKCATGSTWGNQGGVVPY
jgi:hypothetical protein